MVFFHSSRMLIAPHKSLSLSTFSPNCSRKTRRLIKGRKPRCFGCMKTTYPRYWIVLMSQGNTSLTLNRIFQDFLVVLRILKVLINLQKDSLASCSSDIISLFLVSFMEKVSEISKLFFSDLGDFGGAVRLKERRKRRKEGSKQRLFTWYKLLHMRC